MYRVNVIRGVNLERNNVVLTFRGYSSGATWDAIGLQQRGVRSAMLEEREREEEEEERCYGGLDLFQGSYSFVGIGCDGIDIAEILIL
jgi:hypothetical protein